MTFTKPTLKAFILGCMALLMSACSMLPSAPSRTETATPAADAAAETTGETAEQEKPPFVLEGPDENPYLQQQVDVPDAARQVFSQAVDAIKNEQWQTAEVLLQQLTAEQPTLSGPFVNLGIVYHKTNRPEQAEQAFNQAITVNSLNLEAYNQLALLKREQGDFKAAEQNYLAALQVWPKHAMSHRNLGILYDLYMGQWAKALQQFQIYQYLAGGDDKLMAGWIIDLRRRVDAQLQAGAQP